MDGTFIARTFDIDFAKREVVLCSDDAADLGVRTGSRVKVVSKKAASVAIVNTTKKFVKQGEIGLFSKISKELKAEKGDKVAVHPVDRPSSVVFIKKKLAGEKLDAKEIQKVIDDMVSESMSDIEISAWVCALEAGGMTLEEVTSLTTSMALSGDTLELEGNVYDKHSIGGVPGNKITPLIIPIVAACGLKIPKTSSRAITSPSGTADMIELFCNVSFSLAEIKEIVEKTNGCMVWGGAVNLAPCDDMMIQAEFPLDLDPRPLLLASVMSKKKAVGANYCVIDLPVGHQTKLDNLPLGEKLARDFIDLGARIDMQVECALTYGGQPIGRAVGPALEAREALLSVKAGVGPESLIEKSCAIAGMLLEMGGVAPRDRGAAHALEVLMSGKAYAKFQEIIEAQGGNPKIKVEDIPIGRYTFDVKADSRGYVSKVSNSGIKLVARAAGAPRDKGAGVLLAQKVGAKVNAGDVLFTVYAERESKLSNAQVLVNSLNPVKVEGMVLETMNPNNPNIRIK